ncbi:TetR/AcrR family transcriptional regulator [Arthrobacter sp. NPDC056493]|uniref:TetR/AcrR family transcriptional regulator n=1 Tax=Arthrobacter sp. NPDC056493 TaxID=3345839 RepID=UPI0036728D34
MSVEQGPLRRRPGNSAGITRDRIVAAARAIGPTSLTMQAVATELGVDRKAITYHVADREQLLSLLAVDAFKTRFQRTKIAPTATWDEALVAFATSVANSLIASGSVAVYFRLAGETDFGMVEPAEVVLKRMIDAGFREEDAGRALSMMTNLAMGFARDVILNSDPDGHPQQPELHRVLDASGSGELSVLRHLDSSGFSTYDDRQLEFLVRTTISGLRALQVD